jgi:hypothetical protein
VRIEKINPRVVESGSILISEFMKGAFIAGLKDDRVKYIVKAKEEDNSLAQLVETALQEENSIKSQRWKANPGGVTRPNQENVGSLRFCRPQGGECSNLCQVL